MPKKRPKKKVRKAAKKPQKKAARKPAGKAGKRAAAGPKPERKKKPAPKKRRRAKSIDFAKLTFRQTVASLAEHLEEEGHDPVLTGSACAAIYVGPSSKPKAIDFVIGEYTAGELDRTMKLLGFRRSSMNHYENKDSPFDVIFSPPPLAVGDDVVRDIATAHARPGRFMLLNPTDCVRQRLSMFYRWGDRNAFYEAVEVVKRHDIDMELVKRWSEWEWCSDKFAEFISTIEEEGGI